MLIGRKSLVLLLTIGWLTPTALAQFGTGVAPRRDDLAQPAEKFSIETIISHKPVGPGDMVHVGVEIRVAKGFWLDGPVPGGTLVRPIPLLVRAGPSPLNPGEALYPPTRVHTVTLGQTSETYNVYTGSAVIYVSAQVPRDVAPGTYALPVEITAQVCDESTCVPVNEQMQVSVVVGASSVPSPEWSPALAQGLMAARTAGQWREILETPAAPSPAATGAASLGVVAAYLGLAFLAGLALNIMPCVLPVIPLKILSIVRQSRESTRRFRTLGLAYMSGMVMFFVALGVANVILKILFAYTFNWGDLFTYPQFVYGMTLVLVALSANMFGLFAVAVPSRVASAQPREGHAGAVGMGFLTAVLSTPCSFGILMATFVWAQAQSAWMGTLVLLIIGLGMASPYGLLLAMPQLMARIPPAGRWTELFKQSTGFVMVLVALWLLSTQMPPEANYPFWVAGFAVVLAMCLWMWGSWTHYDAPRGRKWTVRIIALALAVGAGWFMLRPARPLAVRFERFDMARITQARADGRIVIVDFTASWCLVCKTVEKLVYDDSEVARVLRERNVLVVSGDVTHQDMPASALKSELGELGIPVSAVFPPHRGRPILLRGIFSKRELFDALERVSSSSTDAAATLGAGAGTMPVAQRP